MGKIALIAEKLTPNLGVRLREGTFEEIQDNSGDTSEGVNFSSFKELVKMHSPVLLEGKARVLPYKEIIGAKTTERKVGHNAFDFLLWHTDRGPNTFMALASDPEGDYSQQPNTAFARSLDVMSRMREVFPDFISRLGKLKGIDRSADSLLDSDPPLEILEGMLRGYHSNRESTKIGKVQGINIIRGASILFLKAINELSYEEILSYQMPVREMDANHGRAIKNQMNIVTMYGQLLSDFQNIAQVRNYVQKMFEVPNSYSHIWEPNQVLVWSGEDLDLCHGRFAHKGQKTTVPLERIIGLYRD